MKKRVLIREARKRVIVMFGDIWGFGVWTRRSASSPDEFRRLMVGYLDVCEELRDRNRGTFIKQLGDGFIAVFEMQEGHNCHLALHVIQEMEWLTKKMGTVIQACSYPRPNGFRARVVAGPAYKTNTIYREDESRNEVDYLGYSVNLCSRLLQVSREVPCVMHESVRDLLGPKQIKRLTMNHLDLKDRPPRGIDEEDMRGLWQVTTKKKGRNRHAHR